MKISLSLIFLYSCLQALIAMPITPYIATPSQIDSMRKVSAYHQALDSKPTPSTDMENGLSEGCKPVTMIFAKGTGESGNVGDGSSPGPAWFTAIRKALGKENVAIQGIQYDASLYGYLLGGDPEGSEKFLNVTNAAATQCPNTKIVIGGYSQGAQLAHNAAQKLSPTVASRVVAAVLFGDPYESQSLGQIPSASVMSICHDNDMICKQFGGAAAHLNYSEDAFDAASFVMTKVK